MQRITCLLMSGVAACVVGAPALAQTSAPYRSYKMSYFLPKTRVGVLVTQHILSCPTSAKPAPEIETTITITPNVVPDTKRYLWVDLRSGPFAKRTTDLTLTNDGIPKTFNATTEGQGEAILSATIKTAATIGSWFVSPVVGALAGAAAPIIMSGGTKMKVSPEFLAQLEIYTKAIKPTLNCTPETLAAEGARAEAAANIAQLEALIRAGKDSPGTLDELKHLREIRAKADESLSLTAKRAVLVPDFDSSEGKVWIAPVDYTPWFGIVAPPELAPMPGSKGFRVNWKANAALQGVLKVGDGSPSPTGPSPSFFYLKPVPAAVSISPCADDKKETCSDDERPIASALYNDQNVSLPQLSGLFSIPIGRGGLFGSREAMVELSDQGGPTRLKYGSQSGAGASSVVDAVGEGMTTLRDARSSATERELKELRALKERRELLKALSSASDEPAAN